MKRTVSECKFFLRGKCMKRDLRCAFQDLKESEEVKCPNCKETQIPCACMRNICKDCGKPVCNITFTVCDECWDKQFKKPIPFDYEKWKIEKMKEFDEKIKNKEFIGQDYNDEETYMDWLEVHHLKMRQLNLASIQ